MRPIHFLVLCCGIVLALWSSSTIQAAEKIEFVPVPGFPQVPTDVTLGKCSAVAVDSLGKAMKILKIDGGDAKKS